MRVNLITYTPEVEKVVYTAARTCYSEKMPMEILENEHDKKQQEQLLKRILATGHHSVLEHASFCFEISGISRAASHQIVRHRLASFSQQSQRYVIADEAFSYVIPPEISDKPGLKDKYKKIMEALHGWYREFIDAGIKAEDARFILPAGASTNLVMTMNARELLHFFSLRCCRRAQWEIRNIAWLMLKKTRNVAPLIFSKAGPACVSSSTGCSEGVSSCGKPYSDEEIEKLLSSLD